jgi:hypothetical protein
MWSLASDVNCSEADVYPNVRKCRVVRARTVSVGELSDQRYDGHQDPDYGILVNAVGNYLQAVRTMLL